MPGKKNVVKKVIEKVTKKKKPKVNKPGPKPKKNKKSVNNKKNTTNKNKKNTTTSNKSWDNPDITTAEASKKIIATGGKNIGRFLKYGTILAGLKETLGDWTGLTNLITGKGKYAAPSQNMENYDANPGIKTGGKDPDSKNYEVPDQFQQGGPVFNFKGQQVPGMRTDAPMTRDERGVYRRGGSKRK
jgi:hypothetical protein